MSDLKTQFRGYNKTQVNQLMKESDETIKALEAKIISLNEEIDRLNEQSSLLTHRVNISEKTNEEIARLALKEASNLIDKAKRNANMILKESLDYVRSLSDEMSDFKSQTIKFRTSVEQMSKDILETIDKSEVFNLINEEEV